MLQEKNQGQNILDIREVSSEYYSVERSTERYLLLLFEGEGSFSVDLTNYYFKGYTVLFLTPCQHIRLCSNCPIRCWELTFHGDFYCIEYHKKEVACNGLLFNNIYSEPYLVLDQVAYDELLFYFLKIQNELNVVSAFSDAVLRSYLQLILALCSRMKQEQIQIEQSTDMKRHHDIVQLQQLFDSYYLKHREVAFYAGMLGLSPSALNKRTKLCFGKTPSQLIQERVILEAKKQLHLTRKSVKEIAAYLEFTDEFYFSRYFKKLVGISPAHFREKTGISVVADLSM